ncbi:MAG: pantoate--beta-alanine ligase [Pseudomonadota bacterium]
MAKSPPMPTLLHSLDALRALVRSRRQSGERIGFVPTMGALHQGHLSLVDQAGQHAQTVIVSIFVNPKQFAPGEDFQSYPRAETEDIDKLAKTAATHVFLPPPALMYPKGHATDIVMAGPASGLETEYRPHFFGGVATVVAKLFNQVQPDCAVFGEKDYQQLLVIRQLVQDLDFPIEILSGATFRETDGLAMSSRNAYLSAEDRAKAAMLYATLGWAREAIKGGAVIKTVETEAAERLRAAGFEPIDYVSVRDAATLARVGLLDRPCRLLAAAWLGKTRLIDNIAL